MKVAPAYPQSTQETSLCQSRTHRVRLVTTSAELEAVQRLRFEVFNLELNEGLNSAYLTGLDVDAFDEVCDHLIVEHLATGEAVGTYRLQTGLNALAREGYYSANEFDFAPFEAVRGEMIELGRACVALDHRSLAVINLLWRAIALYAVARNGRYLIGCSSLSSQDPALGWGTFLQMQDALVAREFRTTPLPGLQLDPAEPLANCPRPPRLLRAYLQAGAKICGEPAIDREFRTIDFLTFMDLQNAATSYRNHFFV